MYKLESRWNKRGIKKCPKCGTFNGNRAISCKNRTCQQALSRRRPDPIKNGHFGAVQIKHALEQTVKIYSIRKLNGTKLVRGFVEIRDCMDKVQDQLLQLKTAICYVDCQPHADQEGTCQHVRVASVTQERAEEMAFDSGNLQKLNINTAIRDAILKQQLKCRSEETPLVQKVSADTFVVRCDDKHHPSVPFCHVQLMYPDRIIYDCQVADNEEESTSCHHAFVVAAAILSTPKYYPVFKEIIDRFVISSDVPQEKFVPSEISVLNGAIFLTSSPTITDNSSQDIQNSDKLLLATIEKSDIQLIDCNLAFQSELGNMCFAGPGDETPARVSPIIELVNSNENSICGAEAFAADYEDNLQLMDCQIELMDQFSLTDRIDFCPSDVELSDDNLVTDKCLDSPVVSSEHLTETVSSSAKQSKPKLLEITTKKGALKQSAKVAKEKLKKGSYNVRRLMKILESNGVVFNRLKRSRAMELAAAEDRPLSAGTLPSYEATVCNLSFTSWLEHVIEQLNSVMEYDGDGKPPPQVFSIHEDFFRCLRARFSVGHTYRMPDHDLVLSQGVRKGLLCQVYNFSCYKSLRNALKTDKIALKFEKSFCRTADGTFEEIDLSDAPSSSQVHATKGLLIKAHQYKTYIKMGAYRSDPSGRVYYFVIEWIAGTLPRSGFGELRITLEYGHKENHLHVDPPVGTSLRNGISVLEKGPS